MKNITKYNLKAGAVALAGVLLLFSALTYAMAPSTDRFELDSILPLGFIEGLIFAFGFGFGFPVWFSVVVISGLSFLIFMVFLWVTRKIIKTDGYKK